MNFPLLPKWARFVPVIVLAYSTSGFGFALLGPYADWMQVSNGYRMPGDIGGPVNIGEGYRWNVPVVTYGFDSSFLQHFGSNGVAAVEEAFQVINDLPPASNIRLEDYPLEALAINQLAALQQLIDLKSATLQVIVEQMGLAEPMHSIFTLRRWDPILFLYQDSRSWPPGTIPNLVLERNFDPVTFLPSHRVNIGEQVGVVGGSPPGMADIYEYEIDPTVYDAAVADQWPLVLAHFWQGLTRDDVGGLRYLLSSNNIAYEVLLPDIQAAETEAAKGHGKGHAKHDKEPKGSKHGKPTNGFVSGALRPGLEKVTFVKQDYDARRGEWVPVAYQFTDTYISNSVANQQELERVVAEPDFLFAAGDVPVEPPGARPVLVTTDTSNWWNSTASATEPKQGPGIIVPQVQVTFSIHLRWGSFHGSTNEPIIYPRVH